MDNETAMVQTTPGKAAAYAAFKAEQEKKAVADELHNERHNEGIAIIEEAYIPNFSKTHIRADHPDGNCVGRYRPLGTTQA